MLPTDVGVSHRHHETTDRPGGAGRLRADDIGLVGKYVSPSSQFLVDPKTGRAWDYTLWIVVFDRRPVAEGEEEVVEADYEIVDETEDK